MYEMNWQNTSSFNSDSFWIAKIKLKKIIKIKILFLRLAVLQALIL
jgi:hypothetical protein